MPALNKDEVKKYLLKKDKKLLSIIKLVPYPIFHRNKDVYGALLNSIISQQLSVKAAATIHSRLLSLFPENDPKPELMIDMSLAKLRGAGLSKQKIGYVKAIAKVASDNGLRHEELSKKSDDDLIKYLTELHGVGQWTAEIILMFSFNRKNSFPVGDVGIQNAMRRLYKLDEEGQEFKKKLISIAEQWHPYRAVVCRYLWGWKSTGYK